jgi:hypothetical protein
MSYDMSFQDWLKIGGKDVEITWREVNKMQEGLLWFDADPKRDLAEKVRSAADRYRFKFGRWPNLCYVNPSMLPTSGWSGRQARIASRSESSVPGAQASGVGDSWKDRSENDSLQLDGVRLVPADNVLTHYFWIGVEEAAELREAA